MFITNKLFSFAFVAAMVATPVLLHADTPGRHPAYLHARSDLRTAQWIMRVQDERNVMHRIHQADIEIDRAIHEIDRAARFDHKDVNDHPPIDTRLDRGGRFRKTMELLQSARADIAREEDNPNASGWRDLAYRHIDAAMGFVKAAARDLHMDRELGW